MGFQILLVDDNPTNLQVLYQTLDGHGYRLLAARSGKDALAIAERATPDLILLDVMMPDIDGFETCARLKADPRTRDAAIIFLSALNEPREKARGLDLGAVDFVNKPFQAEEVLARVRTHLTMRDLQRQLRVRNEALEHELSVAQELLREARDRTDGVTLGESPAAVRLRQDIEIAARSDQTWLINGPPGSDHEAVARAVHHQSTRASRAIICVNCLSLTPDTPRTPQTRERRDDIFDKMDLANGGTLYIEGIEHLAPDWQLMLADRLRMIDQSRTASGTADPDVRVLVSTTRDVDDAVASGRLIAELRRALPNALDLVPLRARMEDLPTLAPFILRRQAEQSGRTVPIISDESLARLKNHRWPGNLRELRNVLSLALSANQGGVLEIGEQLLDGSLRIGSYNLIERLGSGGMGDVWLARHQLLARPAAIKIVREPEVGGDEGHARRQRFAREAQVTSELQSPHTVQLYDFGITDAGNFYYVMERLRGMDLQRMVERHGPIPPERAVFMLRQACLSLAEAHALGLVHRDVKPANLFACRLGPQYDFVKVVDFGVVSRHMRPTKSQITTVGTVLGTPAYLAPELVGGGHTFDGRADLYALGCVAFFLLTGRTPFEGDDAIAVLMQHANTPPSAPSMMSEEPIPPEIDAIVLDCLAKDPSRRPASAETLLDRLGRVPLRTEWTPAKARTWWEMHEPELIGS